MSDQTAVTSAQPKRKVTKLRAAAFAVCDIYGGGYGNIQSLYLSLFWVTFCGLTIAQANGIMGVATVLSAVMAIVVGAVSDNLYRTKFGRRFGRRRPLMVFGAFCLLLAITMWIPGFSYGYYFAIFFIWTAMNQVIMIPFYALSSEMTDNFEERTMLQTMRSSFPGIINALLPLATGGILKWFGENQGTYTAIGTGTTILFALCVLASVAATWEKTPEEMGITEEEMGKKQSLADHAKELGKIILGYLTTLRLRAFQKHLAIYLLVQSFLDVANYCFTFFIVYALSGSAALASSLLALSILSAFAAPLFGMIFSKFGVRGGYIVACVGAIVCLCGYAALVPMHDALGAAFIPVLYVLQAVWMIFRGDLYYLVWVAYPYLPDIDEIVTRERREGVYMGAILFFRRVTQGIAISLLGVYLASAGFNAKAKTQPASAVDALLNSYVWIVVAGMVLVLIIGLTYNLNKQTHSVLVKEVERLKAGGSKADVDPETKKVVESLTGVKYEKCWPDKD